MSLHRLSFNPMLPLVGSFISLSKLFFSLFETRPHETWDFMKGSTIMLYCKGVSQYCLHCILARYSGIFLVFDRVTSSSFQCSDLGLLLTTQSTSQGSFEVAIFLPCKIGFHMTFFKHRSCHLSFPHVLICPVFSYLSLLKLLFPCFSTGHHSSDLCSLPQWTISSLLASTSIPL